MFKYEHHKAKLAPVNVFRKRLIKTAIFSICIFLFSLMIGILGYHFLGRMPWIESFLNASMILGGMGPVDDLPNKASKIFAGCYALYSGVAFISGIAIFMTPILHRFLHKFHLDDNEMRGM